MAETGGMNAASAGGMSVGQVTAGDLQAAAAAATTKPDVAVAINHVDVLFGPGAHTQAALQQLDAGGSRDEILASTGVVLGVADASLSVPTGSVSVLMGLSGSGKSSLLRCVNGLNKITRGSITVSTADGPVELAGLKGGALRKIRRQSLAMVFQQFGLLPWASVRENIGFGLKVRGESDADIKRAVDRQLELVSLEAWADKAIHTLSGGMQQRVGLARAFATDADILLMDEPFSALDPLIREHLQDELLVLQNELKKTILFVSHDLDEALKIGNSISIMEAGLIVQTGTADDIVFRPASDYVRRFAASINPLAVLTAGAIMQPLSPTGDRCEYPEANCRFQLDAAGAPLAMNLSGTDVKLAPFTGTEAPVMAPAVATVDAGIGVRELLWQVEASSHPVIVTAAGRLVGLIEPVDILRALRR